MKPVSTINITTNQEVITQLPYNTADAATLQTQSFRLQQPGPHASVLTGNNWAFPDRPALDKSRVLDGASIAPIVDQNGVIIGYVQATADGYGHPSDSHELNQVAESSNLVTQFCAEDLAESFAENATATEEHLTERVRLSVERADLTLQSQRNRQTCSLMVSVILSSLENPLALHLSAGDLSALFVDPITLEVTEEAQATQLLEHNVGDNGSSAMPTTAQKAFLRSKGAPEFFTSRSSLKGYLLHVTDGVTDLLKTSETKEDNKVITAIDCQALQNELKKELNHNESSNTKHSKVAITKALNTIITRRLIETRQEATSTKEKFEKAQAFLEKIDEYNREHGELQRHKYKLVDFSKNFEAICNEIKAKDGSDDAIINVAKNCLNEALALDSKGSYTLQTFLGFIPTTKYPQASGDDTTITIVDTPDPKAELVRAWIEHPSNRDSLLSRMQDFTQEDINHAIAVLADEKVIRNDNGAYANQEEALYKRELLEANKHLLAFSLGLDQTYAKDSSVQDAINNFLNATSKEGFEERNAHDSELTKLMKQPNASTSFLSWARELPGRPVVWKNSAAIVGFVAAAGSVSSIAGYWISSVLSGTNLADHSTLLIGLAIAAIASAAIGIGFVVDGRRKGVNAAGCKVAKQFALMQKQAKKTTNDTSEKNEEGPSNS